MPTPNSAAESRIALQKLVADLSEPDFPAAFDSYLSLPPDTRLLLADALFRSAFTETADDAASQTVADVLHDVATDPGLYERN